MNKLKAIAACILLAACTAFAIYAAPGMHRYIDFDEANAFWRKLMEESEK